MTYLNLKKYLCLPLIGMLICSCGNFLEDDASAVSGLQSDQAKIDTLSGKLLLALVDKVKEDPQSGLALQQSQGRKCFPDSLKLNEEQAEKFTVSVLSILRVTQNIQLVESVDAVTMAISVVMTSVELNLPEGFEASFATCSSGLLMEAVTSEKDGIAEQVSISDENRGPLVAITMASSIKMIQKVVPDETTQKSLVAKASEVGVRSCTDHLFSPPGSPLSQESSGDQESGVIGHLGDCASYSVNAFTSIGTVDKDFFLASTEGAMAALGPFMRDNELPPEQFGVYVGDMIGDMFNEMTSDGFQGSDGVFHGMGINNKNDSGEFFAEFSDHMFNPLVNADLFPPDYFSHEHMEEALVGGGQRMAQVFFEHAEVYDELFGLGFGEGQDISGMGSYSMNFMGGPMDAFIGMSQGEGARFEYDDLAEFTGDMSFSLQMGISHMSPEFMAMEAQQFAEMQGGMMQGFMGHAAGMGMSGDMLSGSLNGWNQGTNSFFEHGMEGAFFQQFDGHDMEAMWDQDFSVHVQVAVQVFNITGFDQAAYEQQRQELNETRKICYSKKSEVECNSFVDEQGEKPCSWGSNDSYYSMESSTNGSSDSDNFSCDISEEIVFGGSQGSGDSGPQGGGSGQQQGGGSGDSYGSDSYGSDSYGSDPVPPGGDSGPPGGDSGPPGGDSGPPGGGSGDSYGGYSYGSDSYGSDSGPQGEGFGPQSGGSGPHGMGGGGGPF